MTINDPISDLFTRIRNGLQVKHEQIVVPYSKLKFNILKVLKKEGYIGNIEIKSEGLNKKIINVVLKYDNNGNKIIDTIKRVSKTGKRYYIKKKDIPKILNGYGISIVSTSLGIMTGKQARVKNVGGEMIGIVY